MNEQTHKLLPVKKGEGYMEIWGKVESIAGGFKKLVNPCLRFLNNRNDC